jgi:hypothetical protein
MTTFWKDCGNFLSIGKLEYKRIESTFTISLSLIFLQACLGYCVSPESIDINTHERKQKTRNGFWRSSSPAGLIAGKTEMFQNYP